MNIKPRLTSILLLFLLVSCGPPQPQYQTNYQLIPPKSENGRMCLNNCLGMHQNCRQSCSIQTQQCAINMSVAEHNARYQADLDFDSYVQERKAQGKLIKKDHSNFYSAPSGSCEQEACQAQCAGDYNMCYSNCGGQVIPHTACVANCNMPAPGQPQYQ